jgi:probable HAF family extracellular repeat protein
VWYGTVTLPAGGTRCVSWGSKGGSYFVSDLIQCVGANEIGEVAGYRIGDSGYPQAAVIRQGVRTDLGTLGGQWSRAIAINNGGQILGLSQTASGESRPFLWSNGAMVALSSLPSGATAIAINDRGQVVGYLPTSGYTGRMFVWQKDGYRFLPSLNALGELPTDINLHAQIIGSGSAGPVLWQNEQAYLLNGLIDPEDPLRLVTRIRSVRAINDLGQIVGYATVNGVDRPVRLDPVLPK